MEKSSSPWSDTVPSTFQSPDGRSVWEADEKHRSTMQKYESDHAAAEEALEGSQFRTAAACVESGRHSRQRFALAMLQIMFSAAIGVYVCHLLLTYFSFKDTVQNYSAPSTSNPWKEAGKVPLEAHIMSKCPDARDCLRDLVLPAMIEAGSDVDFKLSYIGRPTHDDDGVECMHGPAECLGNILELCAADLYPDPKLYLGFTMCLTSQFRDVPKRDLVEECALEHGISFEKLNACASDDGGKGLELLKASVERSQAANVTKSCTVRVDEEIWCVRDGGEWKECPGGSSVKDLVKEIRRLA